MNTRTPKLNLPFIIPGFGRHVRPIPGDVLVLEAAQYQRHGYMRGFGRHRLNRVEHTTYTTIEKRAVA